MPPDEFTSGSMTSAQRPGRNAEPTGFSLAKDSVVVQPGYVHVNKERNGGGQRLRSARYDGMLRSRTRNNSEKTLSQGIGPAKAFGFGLLSLARMSAMKDLQELTRFEDRLTYLYLEKGHIEQHQTSVAYVTEKETVPIPAAEPGAVDARAGHHHHPRRHPQPGRLQLPGGLVRRRGHAILQLRPRRDLSRRQTAAAGRTVLQPADPRRRRPPDVRKALRRAAGARA